MTLQDSGRRVGLAFRASERNLELGLLLFGGGFLALAWRSLDLVGLLPENASRVFVQFVAIAAFGHAALRLLAPRAHPALFPTAFILTAIGFAFVVRLAPDFATDQVNWAALGVVLMVGTAAASSRFGRLRSYRYTAGAAAVALLVLTGLVGETINGARLWISVAGQTVQTTELIKLLLVVFLAGYLVNEGAVLESPGFRIAGRTYSALPYLIPLALLLVMTLAALALLRDLGSVALLLLVTIAGLYAATGRLRFVAGGLLVLALAGVAGYLVFSHAEARVDIWLHPFDDPSGTGYQTVQSTFAIANGGVTGTGLGLGSPDVIPAAATDYVYTAVAEELGLAGALAVALLFAALLYSGLQVALEARDRYLQLLATTIAALIAMQAAVIIGGNLRLIPTTGITLPFVSYGGSSLVVNYVLVGVLAGISDRTRRGQ